MTRKSTEMGKQGDGARRIHHEDAKSAKISRVVGHGMTRKFTERKNKGMARVGFTAKSAKISRVVGHGMTQKSTEEEI